MRYEEPKLDMVLLLHSFDVMMLVSGGPDDDVDTVEGGEF